MSAQAKFWENASLLDIQAPKDGPEIGAVDLQMDNSINSGAPWGLRIRLSRLFPE
ncbi:MAG: hypothetical protein JWM11_2461 [Planctomycetaceae bacterium]|nr:hypothetical protein [Planctomycetaceae bacterium]